MKIAVHNIKGKETTKKVDLSKDIFGVEPNDHAIYLDVKQYLASQRLGTHSSKERGAVKGSRRKLRKQKGSGAASSEILKILCLGVVVVFLVQDLENMTLR